MSVSLVSCGIGGGSGGSGGSGKKCRGDVSMPSGVVDFAKKNNEWKVVFNLFNKEYI